MPPQHGKTQLVTHGLLYAIERVAKNHLYATYAEHRARYVQADARLIAQALGLRWQGSTQTWRVQNGAQVRWAGINSGIGGYPLSGIAFIDDPYADMAAAQSALTRENVEQWFRSAVIARRHPGSSIIILHTRWHPDDLIGTLKRAPATADGKPWEVINFPAINDQNEVLWPSKRPRSFYDDQKLNSTAFMWEALWQGRPRPRGMAVFQDTHTYAGAVPNGVRRAIGLDFAYSENTYADYSVAVVMAEIGGVYYIEKVLRMQVPSPTFAAQLQLLQLQYPGAPMHAFIGGQEKGIVDFMRRPVPSSDALVNSLRGLPIRYTAASKVGDKLMRAQPVAAAWNAGKVLLPQQHHDVYKDPTKAIGWLSDFVEEVCGFTGVQDRHDDQVDALAGAYYILSRRTAVIDLSLAEFE